MATYTIDLIEQVLRINFGEPAQNDQIVRDATARLDELAATGQLTGGTLLKVNDPASLPFAFVIAHKVAHLYGAIAVYDPKLGNKYVVCITHTPDYKLGEMID